MLSSPFFANPLLFSNAHMHIDALSYAHILIGYESVGIFELKICFSNSFAVFCYLNGSVVIGYESLLSQAS